MNKLKLEDFAPLTGVAAVVFLVVAVILFPAMDYFPTPDRAAEIFSSVANRGFSITLFGMYAGLALMWFSGSLFGLLKEHEPGPGRLAATALAGGIASGAGLLGGFGVVYMAAGQAARPGGIDPTQAWVMYSMWSILMGLLHGLVLTVGATGLVALRTRAFPAWFGWASVVLAVGMITPVDFIFEGLALVWLVVAGVWIFMRGTRHTSAAFAGA